MSNSPLVSVCMITYNHERYIAEAIEGVLIQEVDFELELVISDDCSSDLTGDIVRTYLENHSKGNWIKYYRHSENKGMMENFVWALEQCKGKYVALCEGDDYWIDPLKLNNQVRYLEDHDECVATYHDCKILNASGDLFKDFITKKNYCCDRSGLYDIAIYGNFIQTPSFVFRNQFRNLPRYFTELEVGDFFLYLHLAQFGNFKSLDFTGAVYRFGVGTFSGNSGKAMRGKFKKSILTAAKWQSSLTVKFILYLRFNHDKLYLTNKKIYQPINYHNVFSLLGNINFFNLSKGILKMILGTERRRIFGKE